MPPYLPDRSPVRLRLRVEGVVQGVGFRPFVHGLARRLCLGGHVGNDPGGVFIEVEGPRPRVDEFVTGLRVLAPALASIERISAEATPVLGATEFAIVPSQPAGSRLTLVSADSAPCPDCLAELADPADRRYRYPFINCTNCGPRFTIVRGVPYDRPLTTMAPFAMCHACSVEYHDPDNRRFHAQPVCCPRCGPRLNIPLEEAASRLNDGAIVAVKGVGGYHLAVRADHEPAVRRLRASKHREDKPFAVMVGSAGQADLLCQVDAAAAVLLAGRARPIVLLPRRPGSDVAASVAPGRRELGLMLPYSPLHHLLLDAVGTPIVLTSGNISDEPIAFTDDDARARLGPLVDAVLSHDRPIHTRAEDSVVRVVRGSPLPLRRSRGFAPEPVRLRWPAPRPVLSCGAELKNTFCLVRDHHAFVSPHIGDLSSYAALRSYQDGIGHFQRLFDITPQVVAHDLHPDYLSTRYALGLSDVDTVGVQHHHAHIASCLADNDHSGPVIGVAFDGTGYGPNGTIWGGEVLIADLTSYTRAAHLAEVPMPGGVAAIRQPWRMAVAHLDAAFPDSTLARWFDRHPDWPAVRTLARSGTNSPVTSSVGRLFDAIAALLGVRDEVTYEGQAAIELEQLAAPSEGGAYPMSGLNGADLVRAVVSDQLAGVDIPTIAARFHNGLAQAVVRMCAEVRENTGLSTVALSGGVFQNVLLLTRIADGLAAIGFTVLTHRRVPPNDGGICLGQAAVAAALDRATRS